VCGNTTKSEPIFMKASLVFKKGQFKCGATFYLRKRDFQTGIVTTTNILKIYCDSDHSRPYKRIFFANEEFFRFSLLSLHLLLQKKMEVK
jgi:hypothetical protein